jgi:tight adherence protein B
MTPILLAIAASVGVFVLCFALFPALKSNDGADRKKKLLKDSQELGWANFEDDEEDAKLDVALRTYSFTRNESLNALLHKIPGVRSTQLLVTRSGMVSNVMGFWAVIALLTLMAIYLLLPMGIAGVLLGLVLPVLGARKILEMKVEKRNTTFLNMFPDAIDMIVRSVRSGHPLSTALRMIAENMEDPVSTEFQQVVDEITYGRTLMEALYRMAVRVGQQDVNFFVVVVGVQQETGGNLAEVLSNLSNIIRKRKQLRMKIHAMTAEGRISGYMVGGLPFFVLGALKFSSPEYIDPMFTHPTGRFMLGVAVGLVILAQIVIRKLIKIDI